MNEVSRMVVYARFSKRLRAYLRSSQKCANVNYRIDIDNKHWLFVHAAAGGGKCAVLYGSCKRAYLHGGQYELSNDTVLLDTRNVVNTVLVCNQLCKGC